MKTTTGQLLLHINALNNHQKQNNNGKTRKKVAKKVK